MNVQTSIRSYVHTPTTQSELVSLATTHVAMLVQDIMQHPVETTTVDTPLIEAYEQMEAQHIRHLPVLDEGQLVGVITDRDLRYATSPFHPSPVEAEALVEQAMASDPITAGPRDPVEEAARLMRAHTIGCLPVMQGDTLAGIITGSDLLDAVLRLTGMGKPSGRLAVSLPDQPGELARLTARLAERALDIRSVLSYYEPESDAEDGPPRQRFIFHLDTLNVRPLADTLRADGFEVIWPMPKPS